jgi:hypothetical protein
MFFSRKSKGFFVHSNEFATLIARVSSLEPPLTIEAVKELPADQRDDLNSALAELAEGSRRGGFHHAICGICPSRRFLRRATLETKRLREADYLTELLVTQFRAEPEKMTLTMLGADNGVPSDPTNPATKEVLFCGSFSEDFQDAQKRLLEAGLFPERLELSSVALLGGVISYLRSSESKAPTLVLEFGADSTNCYIVNPTGVDLARPIPHGIHSMIPVVQKELGLKDEESAAKLFFSNNFDFTGMGPVLVKRLMKELQSSIGFYEVQTGQSIGQVFCAVLPHGLGWLPTTLSTSLGVSVLQPNLRPWLDSLGVKLADGVAPDNVPATWFGLVSLMGRFEMEAATDETK